MVLTLNPVEELFAEDALHVVDGNNVHVYARHQYIQQHQGVKNIKFFCKLRCSLNKSSVLKNPSIRSSRLTILNSQKYILDLYILITYKRE